MGSWGSYELSRALHDPIVLAMRTMDVVNTGHMTEGVRT
jgi:hypothetical protein